MSGDRSGIYRSPSIEAMRDTEMSTEKKCDEPEEQEEMLDVLKAQHYNNVLKNIYSRAAEPKDEDLVDFDGLRLEIVDELLGSQTSSVVPIPPELASPGSKHWNDERDDRLQRIVSLVERNKAVNATPRQLKKRPVYVPPLRAMSDHPLEPIRVPDQAFAGRSPVSYQSSDEGGSLRKKTSFREGTPNVKRLQVKNTSSRSQTVKEVTKPQLACFDYDKQEYHLKRTSDELYPTSATDFARLPLWLFDDAEKETRTEEEWLALGRETITLEDGSSKERYTKGFSQFYLGGVFQWYECDVLSYNYETRKYRVRFKNARATEKDVFRLKLRFADEDEIAFNKRVAEAEARRDDLTKYRRYERFVKDQPGDSLAPIQPKTLKGSLNRLKDIFEVVTKRKESVKTILKKVRDDYLFAMKQAHVEYIRRHNIIEENRLKCLQLPELTGSQTEKDRAVPIPERSAPFKNQRKAISNADVLRHNVLNAALLEIAKNFSLLTEDTLFIKMERRPEEEPVSVYKFQDRQEEHFNNLYESLNVDWRQAALNLIRDLEVGPGYDFFIKEVDEFDKLPLKRYLKKVYLLMQSQLRCIVRSSVDEWVDFIEGYPKGKIRPSLLMYKLTSQNDEVVFLPPLDTAMTCFSHMIQIPDAIDEAGTMQSIDKELVPFCRVQSMPLVTNEQCPELAAHICKNAARVEKILQDSLKGPKNLAKLYSEYDYILKVDPEEYAKDWFSKNKPDVLRRIAHGEEEDGQKAAGGEMDNQTVPANAASDKLPDTPNTKFHKMYDMSEVHTPEETMAEVERFYKAIDKIKLLTANEVNFGIITLNCKIIKDQLKEKAKAIVHKLLEGVVAEIFEMNSKLQQMTDDQLRALKDESDNIEQLDDLKMFIKRIKSDLLPVIYERIASTEARMSMLEKFCYRLPEESFQRFWTVKCGPKQIDDMILETKCRIMDAEEQFRVELEQEQVVFTKELQKYGKMAEEFVALGPCSDDDLEKRAQAVDDLEEALEKAEKKREIFNRKEKLFQLTITEYADLEATKLSFAPFAKLWRTASLFVANCAIWMSGPFIELAPKKIASDVNSWWNDLHKLAKKLNIEAKDSQAIQVCEEFKQKLKSFQKHIPLIKNLRNPGLRPRHWKKLSKVLGQSVQADKFLTYNMLLQLDVTKHDEEVEEICTIADKEYSLESGLDNMASEWKQIRFDFKEHRETYVLRGVDEVTEKLEDHIVKTQTMSGSQYIEPFKMRVKTWEAQLQLVAYVLEEWLNVQKTWMYLEPIFGSPDIMRQMPKEGKQFQIVDNVWRTTLKEAFENPEVLEFSARETLLKGWQESNKYLDKIQKGLNDYLETKRLAFPRFYFLSNDELLEILSQTKDPKAVQPHMSKCFEGIVALEFDTTLKIRSMYSAEKENVQFLEPIDPNEGNRKGNVEVWLKDVEAEMRKCLIKYMYDAYDCYPKTERTQWILDWPGQVVLAASSVYWASDCEKAMASKGTRGLKEYIKKLNLQLKDIVKLVRGKLTKLQRKTMSPLVVIDVHARDTLVDMVKDGVSTREDFDWLAQLRYYMNEEEKTLDVSMINATLPYGYEYLGNSMRLVITPLTDRCYRTLMGALKLIYGGAPEGPAGTGKTETVKDLAKALAKQCIVFNCSDQMDYLAMGKFFKGLASQGAWSCFDEFNRINLEVLSVIAQQILSIQTAIRAGKTDFFFEGVQLPLVHSCSVFITMNPGYAGRSDLPDNLKALFRTVAMMVPDYAMIAEIMLYASGYSNARPLSKKIVGCLRLSSEQLSSQFHYDFGMRNVKSILVAAGNQKRNFPDTEEDILCLRALNDCNLSKFTSEDIPLFKGITQDLFPGVTLPQIDYAQFHKIMKDVCARHNVVPNDNLLLRCIQIYDTSVVRHGFMIVGDTFSAKSTHIKVITETMTMLKELNAEGSNKVTTYYINPKSMSLHRLYGSFDEATHEWANGVLAKTIRELASDTSEYLKWLIFDGPVDAIWIENMNTVLDDNKKLCLASGEIIKLSEEMSILFEVDDLSVASPATISRVGMVFSEPSLLGWRPLVTSWLNTLPPVMDEFKEVLNQMFEWLVLPVTEFIRLQMKCMIAASTPAHVMNMIRLLDSFLDIFKEQEKPSQAQHPLIEAAFCFCMIWSMGCNTNVEGREKFAEYFRGVVEGEIEDSLVTEEYKKKKLGMNIPNNGTVFDYYFDIEKKKWIPWMETTERFRIESGTKFEDIIVPTIDTIRHANILEKLITHNRHCLFSGGTGTGKTVVIYNKILNDLSRENWQTICLTFSAQTNEKQTQMIIEGKLQKRTKTKKGPPLGKQAIIFVDDLNMPQKEEYGAQPPIELLRQFMDYSGWYAFDNSYLTLVDVQLVTAMGIPGGGANIVTPRLMRHFNVIGFVPFEADSLTRIFLTIMEYWINENNLTAIRKTAAPCVNASIELYMTSSRELKPTPEKSHYTFNLRDLSAVFQGISDVSPKMISSKFDLIKLWAHECSRVFSDRLVNEADLSWFKKKVSSLADKHFKIKYMHDILEDDPNANIFFTSFHTGALEPEYCFVEDYEKMRAVVMESMDDYNQVLTDETSEKERAPLDLVLFETAISHICRITRQISKARGSMVLVGVGGSGRQSLTRLSANIIGYNLMQVEVSNAYQVTDWKEDLKKLFKQAGVQGKHTVFLLTDTQIKFESMLEDINNILNNGEVPSLFPSDELPQVIEEVSTVAKKAGLATDAQSVYTLFINRCKTYIHICLAISPVGDDFRNRIRNYPALVNCCNINWFHRWEENALSSVAGVFLKDVPLDKDVKEQVVEACVYMQENILVTAADFLASMRFSTYATPTSYLDLLKTFQGLFEKCRNKIKDAKDRYDNGLEKLKSTAVQVKEMQEQLEELQPKLDVAVVETDKLMENIKVKQADADSKKKVVAVEEANCNKQAAEAQDLADECQRELDIAMPAYHKAMAALKVIKKSDLAQVKTFASPPAAVVMTLEAVCIMMKVKPKRVGEVGKKRDDYWEPAKREVLSDTRLLDKLQSYDKDNIDPDVIEKILPYIENLEFKPSIVANSSGACKGLCLWVRALYTYHTVAKVVEPKKESLKIAKATVEKAMKELKVKKDELGKITAILDALNADYDQAVKKKNDLAQQVADCAKRLGRAEKLIGGLGGEEKSWLSKSKKLGNDMENVVGDIVMASGIIAYLGIYTPSFRIQTIERWIRKLKDEIGISCAEPYSLVTTLGDPVQIRQWMFQKLPKDDSSITNAIILTESCRFPLFIDPQGQANKWIRNMEKDSQLTVAKLNDQNLQRTVENCVQFGRPVLIENIQEELSPILEPILLKNTYKSGNRIMIRLGENVIDYDEKFQLYITTKLRTPHYTPNISTKVVLINFVITVIGLDDQMLGIVVAKDEPAMEKKMGEIVIEQAAMKKQLRDIENKILQLLASATGNILDDEELIKTLQKSKEASNAIDKRMAQAKVVEKQIQKVRDEYAWLSLMCANLFFCVSDLGMVDPMYQYSLEWFLALYLRTISNAEQAPEKAIRTAAIFALFKSTLYVNVCRSLFERDKLLFSFTLTLNILEAKGELKGEMFRFVLTGGGVIKHDKKHPNPATEWINDRMWGQLRNLSKLKSWKGIDEHVSNNLKKWRAFFDSKEPARVLLPHNPDATILERMCILRCFRQDKLIPCIQDFVKFYLGEEFIRPPALDLDAAFEDSSVTSPLLFVLSPGSDPFIELMKVAQKRGFSGKDQLFSISLGQGQGPIAAKGIQGGLENGTWVVLQNCHLYPSWMPTLEKLVEDIDASSCNENFRLWLTSMPSEEFPISILQNGVKMTNEPPRGITANLRKTYQAIEQSWFESCELQEELKKLMFGLAFFHAIVQERRKFGPLGWNILYEFNDSDLRISQAQLKMFLDEARGGIPFKTLIYMTGELNYGGRVTDDWDRRTIREILRQYFVPEILNDDFAFSPSGIYYVPEDCTVDDYLQYISTLPLNDDPEIFGMHDNSNITSAIADSMHLLNTVLSLQPRTAVGGETSREDQIMALAKDISKQLPEMYDIEMVQRKYPVMYEECMNTVLAQECMRFNRLLRVVLETLKNIQKAIKGEVVMSLELEKLGDAMYNVKVPELWANAAYPSLKPLGSWIADLIKRLKFLQDWIDEGIPPMFWISGFYFTQSFLTGTLQNHARRNKISIDQISFDFYILTDVTTENTKEAPKVGCYVYGLFMEGAGFDWEAVKMCESKPKQLYIPMPSVWLKPDQTSEIDKTRVLYPCPVYKTSKRAGALSTTGHSTNYVLTINLPSILPEAHWVKRGVAMLCGLDT